MKPLRCAKNKDAEGRTPCSALRDLQPDEQPITCEYGFQAVSEDRPSAIPTKQPFESTFSPLAEGSRNRTRNFAAGNQNISG
jgi:hypothetical protein